MNNRDFAPGAFFLNSGAFRGLFACAALFVCFAAAQPAWAGVVTPTFTVNSTLDLPDATPGDGVCETAAGSGICTLRAAISEANANPNANDIILPAGTYTTTVPTTNENANLNGDFDIASSLRILGEDVNSTIVQANVAPNVATDRVFDVSGATSTVEISGVTIRNGQVTTTAERGGGVRIFGGGLLTLRETFITANRAFSAAAAQVIAGAIYTEASRLTIISSDVNGNACQTTGTSCLAGGIFNFGSAVAAVNITSSRIRNNTSTATGTNGGATGSALTMQSGGTLSISGSTISGNTANGTGTSGGAGAGLRIAGNATVATTLTVTDSSISGNTAGATGTNNLGGGINLALAASGTFNATLTNVTINGNSATASGGGIAITGAAGTTTFNNCRLTNNTLAATVGNAFGGGMSVSGINTVNFNNSVISGNSAASTAAAGSSFGGGINYQDGIISFTDTAISGNSAANGGGIRAAAFSTGTGATATFNRSSVTGNTATDGGGIIFFANGTVAGTLNLNNSTVGGNTAATASGVEIFNFAAGNVTANVNYSTIAGNTATTSSGGAANFGQQTAGAAGIATFNLRSSVVADNTGGASPDILGVITSLGYNHVENTAGGTFTTTAGDVTGTDPVLGPLGLNGGQTPNYLPGLGNPPASPNSPLLDAIPVGVNGCGTAPFNVDQKNVERPFDFDFNGTAGCDKGASERGLVILTVSNLPNGLTMQPYNQTLVADFGNAPYTFSLVSGTLPPGLMLNADGTITGTPTVGGTYNFVAQVQDTLITFRRSKNGTARGGATPNVFQKTFQIVVLNPTAASVSIAGQVIGSQDLGLRNAQVTLTDSQGNSRTVTTGKFGNFRFADVASGSTYIISVASKRYNYPAQIITVTEDLTGLVFTPQ